jgi:hypothetical protein
MGIETMDKMRIPIVFQDCPSAILLATKREGIVEIMDEFGKQE